MSNATQKRVASSQGDNTAARVAVWVLLPLIVWALAVLAVLLILR